MPANAGEILVLVFGIVLGLPLPTHLLLARRDLLRANVVLVNQPIERPASDPQGLRSLCFVAVFAVEGFHDSGSFDGSQRAVVVNVARIG